jgi:hypothetical protein
VSLIKLSDGNKTLIFKFDMVYYYNAYFQIILYL